MARNRAMALATALVAGLMAVGPVQLLTSSQVFGVEISGAGAPRPPPMIRPPVTDMVPVVPSEVFRDLGDRPIGPPEMMPPIDIGDLIMDLGELGPPARPPLVEISDKGTRKVTYFDREGRPVGVVYIFPNNEVYANDPAFAGARAHLQDARVAGNLANTAWVVKIGADVALVILGGPAAASVRHGAWKAGAVTAIYEGSKAAGDTGATKYQAGAPADEIAIEALYDFGIDATVSVVMDVVFLGAGKDARAAINEAQAAIDAGTETVRRGRQILSHLPNKGNVPKTSARKVLNQARELGVPNIAGRKASGKTIRAETKILVNRARRQVAEGGRELAHAHGVETFVGAAREGATNITQGLAAEARGRGEAGQ